MLTSNPTDILVLTGDWHVNDTVGLCPPLFHRGDGDSHNPGKGQQELHNAWQQIWVEAARRKALYGARVYAICMGDLGDMNSHSKTQLISAQKKDVQDALYQLSRNMTTVADHVFVLRGTPAHVGGAGEIEEQFADDVGAERNTERGNHSWWVLKMQVAGVRMAFAHHPPTQSKRPDCRNQAVARAAAISVIRAIRRHARPRDLYAWGHVHYFAEGTEMGAWGLQIPCLKLVGEYGHRIGQTDHIEPVGAVFLEIAAGQFRYDPMLFEPKEDAEWTPES